MTAAAKPAYYATMSAAAQARFDAAPAWQQNAPYMTATSWDGDATGAMKRQDRWTAAHSDPRKRR